MAKFIFGVVCGVAGVIGIKKAYAKGYKNAIKDTKYMFDLISDMYEATEKI